MLHGRAAHRRRAPLRGVRGAVRRARAPAGRGVRPLHPVVRAAPAPGPLPGSPAAHVRARQPGRALAERAHPCRRPARGRAARHARAVPGRPPRLVRALTDAGLARIEAALPAHLEHLDEYFVCLLTPEELQQLTDLLRKVRDHVNPRPRIPRRRLDTRSVPQDRLPARLPWSGMERQAGLGRSLDEVIESLTTAETDARSHAVPTFTTSPRSCTDWCSTRRSTRRRRRSRGKKKAKARNPTSVGRLKQTRSPPACRAKNPDREGIDMALFGPQARDAHARPGAPGPRRHDARAGAHYVNGHTLAAAVPRAGLETAMFGLGLLLGRRAALLEAAGRVHHRGGLRGRHHAEPVVPGGVLRAHRPHRGGARGVRPLGDHLRPAAQGRSGRATTPPRACARATTSARSTAPASTPSATSSSPPAKTSRDLYQDVLNAAGYGEITTEILPAPTFYYAEDYHQQYLAKNPGGYCGLGGTGLSCPVGLAETETDTRHRRRLTHARRLDHVDHVDRRRRPGRRPPRSHARAGTATPRTRRPPRSPRSPTTRVHIAYTNASRPASAMPAPARPNCDADDRARRRANRSAASRAGAGTRPGRLSSNRLP